MTPIFQSISRWATELVDRWNQFWFTPSAPHTLAMIRILAGSMLFYTHLVYTLDLMSFLGPNSWITVKVSRQLYESMGVNSAWSYLWYVQSPALLWILHILALVVFAMFTLGFYSRTTSVLAWLITVSYCHRLNGSWFGLDQINVLLAMYLMLGPCGAVYSLDRWLKSRRAGNALKPPQPSSGTTIAIRLIQLHMCVIYMFGGIAKMRGDMWWDGRAVWYAVANLEYQSLDMTWMVHFPWLIALLAHVTVIWETFYCALIWPRLTRPIVLFLAVCVHGGIALFLGMITFGLVMLIGNLAFVSPNLIRALVDRSLRLFHTEDEDDVTISNSEPKKKGGHKKPRRK